MNHPKLEPVGIEDFKEMRTSLTPSGEPFPYCDKTLMIKDILDSRNKVMLFTRPRRFGKTLNLSMLKYFFGTKEPLFDGLKIAEHKNIMEGDYRSFPVLFLNFKDLIAPTFDALKVKLKQGIFEIYQNFAYLLDSDKISIDVRRVLAEYRRIDFPDSLIEPAFWWLTFALYHYHGQKHKVIVLIDEYDAPLQKAYIEGYLDQALDVLRPLLSKLLKGNPFLHQGVITGISRIARENIFSGLNNFGTFDISENPYAEYFGFTESEVQAMIEPQDLKAVKEWYNGYIFGSNTVMYNPWSILNFLQFRQLKAYWINSSANALIKESLTADKMEDVQMLIDGGEIQIRYNPHLILRDLKTNDSAFWNLMYTSGYLTSEKRDPNDIEVPRYKSMHIPNEEVKQFFEDCVIGWFGNGEGDRFLERFCDSLLKGNNVEKVQALLVKAIRNTVGFHDVTVITQESFYHGLLLGITLQLKGRYDVKSNRQSGYGRYDIALFPKKPNRDLGVIIEIKTKKTNAKAGLAQIENKRYKDDFELIQCTNIIRYGFHFEGMQVTVMMEGEEGESSGEMRQ